MVRIERVYCGKQEERDDDYLTLLGELRYFKSVHQRLWKIVPSMQHKFVQIKEMRPQGRTSFSKT